MNDNYKRYTDFLKDKQFIRWQLSTDEALDAQWQNFTEKNPHLQEQLRQAIDYLKATGLNNSTLQDEDRTQLLHHIQSTLERKANRAKIRRMVQYLVAAGAAIAFILIGLNIFMSPEQRIVPVSQELIVGNLLNSEDIQLITGQEALSFQNDVQVQIDAAGTAKIIQENQADKTVEITQSTLNKLIVPYGKRTQLTLSDGSRVWLNSGSVIEFPAQFTGKEREIHLASGEMYIEVSPDNTKPFYVHTSQFNVKVYGTKFNVSAYADSPQSVVLVEGSVGLQPGNKAELLLSPSQQAVYSETKTFSTQKVDVNQFISWKSGYLAFDKTPMTEVLKQIGRYYNLSFNYEKDANLHKRTCTGKIYLSDNLDNVMTTVALLSSTRYQKEDNRIYITNEPN